MTRNIIRAALAAFFILQITPAFAVPIIFKTNKSILVRTPQGVVAKPGIGELLSTVPGASSSAVANGSFPVNIGKASLPVPITKTYPAASLAAAAADAILSKTAVGAIAALALPYAIDAATDLYMKQVPGETTPAVIDYQVPTNNIVMYYSSYTSQCGGTNKFSSWDTARTYVICTANKQYYSGYAQSVEFLFSSSYNFIAKVNGTNAYTSGSLATTSCTTFGSGYSFDSTTHSCKSTPGCSSPSTYDTAIGMCIGSAINEPANKTQLEQDIADSLGNTPAAAPIILDDLLDHDIEPANGEEEIEQPDPSTVPGGKETETRDYFDPASGHPFHEERTKETTHDVQKKGPQQLDVTPTTETTINITDTVTNQTWIMTETTINEPTESTTPEPDDYTFNAEPPTYDPIIEPPEKTPLEPIFNEKKTQLQTWSSGLGINAESGNCSISSAWDLSGHSTNMVMSFCEWEDQIAAIGIIILSFATLYGGFIILGVR